MLSKTLIKELSKIQTPEQLAEVYNFGKDILDALAKASFKEGDGVFVVPVSYTHLTLPTT